jgi:hypothetical protein
MLRRVALLRTDVSEEPSASIRVTRIGEVGTTLAATSNRRTLRRNTGIYSIKTNLKETRMWNVDWIQVDCDGMHRCGVEGYCEYSN